MDSIPVVYWLVYDVCAATVMHVKINLETYLIIYCIRTFMDEKMQEQNMSLYITNTHLHVYRLGSMSQ